MYIHDRRPVLPRRSKPRVALHIQPRWTCACRRHAFGDPAPQRQPIKEEDVKVHAETAATTGIARRVRTAVAKMSRSQDETLRNTAQRIVDHDVPVRFVDDLKPVDNPESVLAASAMPADEIVKVLQTHTVVEIPGSDPALIPKKGKIRAFERNGTIYIPTKSSDPNLSIDIVHEVNHALNPKRVSVEADAAGFWWERFAAEARAAFVANYRLQRGDSDKAGISLRLEKAIEHAKENAAQQGWANSTEWKTLVEPRMYTWRPDGNLDNHK